MNGRFSFSIILTTICLPLISGLPARADTVAAKWESKQVRFHYSSFDTQYSCFSLRDKMKSIILALGARDDVRVEVQCPGQFYEPRPSIDILLAFAIPVIADPAEITADTFPAEWRPVQLKRGSPRSLDDRECELVDQIKRQVLPVFDVREIEDASSCNPRYFSLSNTRLTMTLLMPVPEDDAILTQD